MREIICVGFFLGAGVEAAKGTVGVELDMVGEVFLVGLFGLGHGNGRVSKEQGVTLEHM